MEPDAGVADQTQAIAEAEHRRAIPGRLSSCRRELARQRPDRKEHEGGTDEGESEEQRWTGADVHLRRHAGDGGDQGGQGPEDDGGHGESTKRLQRCPASGSPAREEHVPAARVLLAAKKPRAGEEAPDRTHDHEGHGHLEHGESADGLQCG